MARTRLAAFGAAGLLLLAQRGLADDLQTGPPPGIVPAAMTIEHVLWASRRAQGRLAAGVAATRREHWNVSFGAMTGTLDYVSAGKNYRADQSLGPSRTAWGRAGDRTWQMNANGQVSTGITLHRSDETDAIAVESPSHPGVTLLGRVAAPVAAYVVRVEPAGGRLEYRFYDAKTFLLDRVEEIRGARRVTVSLDDYRTTDGLSEPWHIHTSDGFATNDGDRVLQTLVAGARIAPSETAIPRNGPPLISLGASPVELPVVTSGDRFIIPVKMGEHTVDFLLDSGADGIVIDNRVADVLGIKQYGRITSETAGTYVESDVVIPRMSVGPITLQGVHAKSLPFTQWTASGTPIAGLLGYDFIHDVVWHVDYQHGTLQAIAPNSFTPPAGAQAFDVSFDDNVPTLGIRINGLEAPAFVLDTGADRSALFSRYVQAHPSELADRGLGQTMTDAHPFVDDFNGVGGTVEYRPLEVGPLLFGKWPFPTWLFEVTQNAPSFEFEDYDGLIGQDLLRNFDLYLDYPHERIYLVPNDRFRQRWPTG